MSADMNAAARSLSGRLHAMCDAHADSPREEILRAVRTLALTVNAPTEGDLFGLNSGGAPLDLNIPTTYRDETIDVIEMIGEVQCALALINGGGEAESTADEKLSDVREHLATLMFSLQARALYTITEVAP